MNRQDLFYVLEKVKAACPDKFGRFHTWEGCPDHEECVQLEKDGLIQLALKDEPSHFLWVLK